MVKSRAFVTFAFVLFILLPKAVSAAPRPVLGVSVAPSLAKAGSANTLTFTFTATDAGNGTTTIGVPPSASKAPWSAPQVSNSALAGYVSVQAGSCNSAGPASVSGNTIQVKFKCTAGKTFKVLYGSGTPKTNAAQLAGPYTFTTQVNSGAGYVPASVQPVVTVNPGAAASLKMTGVADAIAGTSQAGTVTAFDAYDNVAAGYGGTLHFTTTDTKATPPADTAASAGKVNFDIALKTAGTDSLTATDTGNPALKAIATAKITAGGIASITVGISPTLVGYPSPSLPAFPGDGGLFTSCGATPLDPYGNTATFSGNLSWTSTDPYSKLPGCSAPTGCGTPVPVAIYFGCMFGTQGHQTVTVTDPVSGVAGQMGITVIGPIAQPDKVAIVDPTHNAASLYTVNPLDNDDQTSGLTGNTLLGVFTNTIGRVTQQPTYTDDDGFLHQVGVMKPTADGSLLSWEMNPPATMMLPTPGLTFDVCPAGPTTTICHIPTEITAKYTITDGVNESEPGTITIVMDTPDTPQVVPSDTVAIFKGAEPTANGSTPITVSVPGQGSVQVPVLERAMNVTTTPTGLASTYQVSMTFSSPVVLSGKCDPKGCPDTVTLTGTAVLPDSFMASASGSSVSAALQPWLEYQPLDDLWHAGPYQNTLGMFGTATGFLPVTLLNGNPSNPAYLPAGYAGLFGYMTLSCKNATIDVNCPMPNVVIPYGNALLDSVAALSFSGTPQGCASSSVLGQVGQTFTVGVDLDFGTSDVSGSIHVTIWRGHDQGSCTTDPSDGIQLWSLDGTQALETEFDIPVNGNGTYSRTWTPSWAGPYIIRATYSGDYNNTTNGSTFNVFKIQ